MVRSAVDNQENVVPGMFSREGVKEGLEAGGIRCRHDQIKASPVSRAHRTVQVDVFANELGGDLGPGAGRSPARAGPIDAAEPRFVGEHDPQVTSTPGGSPPGFPHGIGKAAFLKSF